MFDSDITIKIISIILGLGFASIFRQVCKDEKCMVIKGPRIEDIQKHIYKIDDKCYKYEPSPTMCDSPN